MKPKAVQPKKLRGEESRHIKGFILNKLYLGGYFSKRGRKHHGKHTSTNNLPRGYPQKHRGDFPQLAQELRREGLIMIFPSTGDEHVCAILDNETIETGLMICNAYRESVGLPPLDKRFREIVKKQDVIPLQQQQQKMLASKARDAC